MARIPGIPQGLVPDVGGLPAESISGAGMRRAVEEVGDAASRLVVLRTGQAAQREYDQAMTGFASAIATKMQEIDQSQEADGLVTGLDQDLGSQLDRYLGTFTVSGEAQRMFRSRATHMLETARAQVLGVEMTRQQARSEAELDLAVSEATRLLTHGGPLHKESVMEMIDQAVIGREATLRIGPEQSQALQHQLRKRPLSALLNTMAAKGQYNEIMALAGEGFWDELDGAEAGQLYNARQLQQGERADRLWNQIWKDPGSVSEEMIRGADLTEGQKNNLLSYRENRGLYLQNVSDARAAREHKAIATAQTERAQEIEHSIARTHEVADPSVRLRLLDEQRKAIEEDQRTSRITTPQATALLRSTWTSESEVARQIKAAKDQQRAENTIEFEIDRFVNPTAYELPEVFEMIRSGEIDAGAGMAYANQYGKHVAAREKFIREVKLGNAVASGDVQFSGTSTELQDAVDQSFLSSAVAGTQLTNPIALEGFVEQVPIPRDPNAEPIASDVVQQLVATNDEAGFARALLTAQTHLQRGAVPIPLLKGAVAGTNSTNPRIALSSARFMVEANQRNPSTLQRVDGGIEALTNARLLLDRNAATAADKDEPEESRQARVLADFRNRRDKLLPERIESVRQASRAFLGLPPGATDADEGAAFTGNVGPPSDQKHFDQVSLPDSVLHHPIVQEAGWESWGEMREGMDWTVAGAAQGFRDLMQRNYQALLLTASKPEDAFAASLALTFREVAPSRFGMDLTKEGPFYDPSSPPRFMRHAPEAVYPGPPEVVRYTLNRVVQEQLYRSGRFPQVKLTEGAREGAVRDAVKRRLGLLDPEHPAHNVMPAGGWSPNRYGFWATVGEKILRGISWPVVAPATALADLPADLADAALVELVDSLGFTDPIVGDVALRGALGQDVKADLERMTPLQAAGARIAKTLIEHGTREDPTGPSSGPWSTKFTTPGDQQAFLTKMLELRRRGDTDAQLKLLRDSGASTVARALMVTGTPQFMYEATPGSTPEWPQYLVLFHNGERYQELRDTDGNLLTVDLHEAMDQGNGTSRPEIVEQPLALFLDADEARREGAFLFGEHVNKILAERGDLSPEDRTAAAKNITFWAKPFVKNMGVLAEPLANEEFVRGVLEGKVELDDVMSTLIARDPNLDRPRVEEAMRGYLNVLRNIANYNVGVIRAGAANQSSDPTVVRNR